MLALVVSSVRRCIFIDISRYEMLNIGICELFE